MTHRKFLRRPFTESLEVRNLLASDCFHVGCVDEVAVLASDSYLPDVPFLLQVKLLDADGSVNRNVWDAAASIQVNTPDATISSTSVDIYNGVGSVYLTVIGAPEKLELTVTLGTHTIEHTLRDVSSNGMTEVAGIISTDTAWSGIVHVTDDVTVAAGSMLTIKPGTFVLFDGVEVTIATESIGAKIVVQGSIKSNGTKDQPVTFTAVNSTKPWGEIHVEGGDVDLKHTIITAAGNSARGGHTSTGPAIRVSNSGTFSMADGAVTDIFGKSMQATSGQVNFTRSLLSRSVMGPETQRTGVLLDATWIVDMDGRFRYDEIVDDNDAIYLHFAQSPIVLKGGVVALMRDDGIDTAGAVATFEDMIVRDVVDKGFSISDGQVTIEHNLIANVGIGVETKVATPFSPQTTINRTTIANANFGIRARGNSSEIQYAVTNSILDVGTDGDAIWVDGDEERTQVSYSLANESWEQGGDNLVGTAGFVNAARNDFRIRLDSPAINAGDPNSPLDPDGSIVDLGYYSILNSENRPLNSTDIDAICAAIRANEDGLRFDVNGDGAISLDDYDYLVSNIMGVSYGDANTDGVFGSRDLVLVFQSGEYEDAVDENSVWADGDWNCDGDFGTADLVAAFQAGRYLREATPGSAIGSAVSFDSVVARADEEFDEGRLTRWRR